MNGDRAGEANETFSVNLSLVDGNAVLADGQVTGTIVDDEPRVRISGVSKNEGNNGTTPGVSHCATWLFSFLLFTFYFLLFTSNCEGPDGSGAPRQRSTSARV